jgi:hypothetical protein
VFKFTLVAGLLMLACATQADEAIPPPQTETIPSSGKWSYVVGARLRYSQLPDLTAQTKLVPVVGLRYGRFKFGTESIATDWLALSTLRREPTVSYDMLSNEKWRVSTALRIHNVTADEAFDLTEPGRKTLRGRLLFSYRLDSDTTLGGEITRDLLNRGDGTTLSFGASRGFPINHYSIVSLNIAVSAADKTHWRTVAAAYEGGNQLNSGLGSVQLGVGYRYSISPKWAWYANTGLSRPVARVADLPGIRQRKSAQIGVLYFSGPQ